MVFGCAAVSLRDQKFFTNQFALRFGTLTES
jgi:hypothetical protein